MNFDLSKAIADIQNNYLPHVDVAHHYVWKITLQEYSSLLTMLGDLFQLLSFNIKPPVVSDDELFDVVVVHNKYVVLQVGFSQALYVKD